MTGRDPWADFEPGPTEEQPEAEHSETSSPKAVPSSPSEDTAAEEKLHSLAEQLIAIEEDLETGKEERKRCCIEIVGTWPEGSYRARDFGDLRLEIERTQRWHWDKDKLAMILAELGQEDTNLPAFVERRTSIDREMFEMAPYAQREKFAEALKTSRGPVKITVTRKGD